MNKLIPASLGAAGVGGAGYGGYLLLNPSENKEVVVTTIREKYKTSLLSFEGTTDEKAWESKFSSLKSGTPNHPDLKAIDTAKEEKAKHKEACKKIYDSPADNKDYFEDFKKYCSKLIGDVVSGTWVTEDGKVDGKLKEVKTNKNSLLHKELKNLFSKLTTDTFDDPIRKELKDWCSSKKDQLFLGEESNIIDEIKKYCTE
ncbi:hypothetical protein MHF_0393 [Mycoplasma haemofelis Ohio2]|uniref:Uncharacterized protein n=1 Tax=Mycoplasma haemofelis (strain Ohio2) TaxID=859194 RepID=F6FH64_MYCHI|nr:hypothetical protein MHF_0393 [Mycoplasma haemofelis Ohio2]